MIYLSSTGLGPDLYKVDLMYNMSVLGTVHVFAPDGQTAEKIAEKILKEV